jgi:hypothetical protein
LPHIDDVEAKSSRRVWRNMTDYCIERLFAICGECKIVEIIFLQREFNG